MNNLETACNSFFDQFKNDKGPARFALDVMYNDISEMKFNNPTVNKLLRLASCPSSPDGERMNAARAAFKLISKYVETNWHLRGTWGRED
ncbi:hypothetical protein BK133_00935 [Paenibacillus sp. FSL H8-0548]|uniref:DUF2786 domain-containing protein n=1 Tax=Paenibacillus sp. FSL H8-0548 TaxID=1920422 RepID=UPI00096D63CD|nr:DUF2786 domain-containing protein [Paenibacillus sp. FSL H8-0548]OMF38799.1 hypothetical protein BK133_00935 [Paenibacillus sp. FSL H8-0548]